MLWRQAPRLTWQGTTRGEHYVPAGPGLGGAGVGGDPWEGPLVMCFACPDSGQDRFAGQLECLSPGDFLPSVVCLIK